MRAPAAADPTWRRDIYDRARQMVASQLRSRQPPASMAETANEQAALEAAIEQIEATFAAPGANNRETKQRPGGPAPATMGLWIGVAILAAALSAGGYVYWSAKPRPPVQSATGVTASHPAPSRSAAAPVRTSVAAVAKDGDLPPGVDGGSTDADLSYVFRRQPTFYRTLEPTGTIIIDKLQHFLYLIRPNNVALRYGIGVGAQCAALVGLRHIAGMAEWPAWQVPPEMASRKLVAASVLPGGPGNPLGARLIALDDGQSRIHGTNAPRTIGTNVTFGCIRLNNDDIVDLYGRVQLNTRVIVN